MDRRHDRLVWAVTVLAFAILVSAAASHLHVAADLDESCAICAAVGIGKLEGPATNLVAPVPLAVNEFRLADLGPPSLPQSAGVVVLPPSCGPPGIA